MIRLLSLSLVCLPATSFAQTGQPGESFTSPSAVVPELDDEPSEPSTSEAAGSSELPAPSAAAPLTTGLESGEDEYGDIRALLGEADGEWVLDDGVSLEDVPWDDYDPVSMYTPRGLLHVGLQLRVAMLPGGEDSVPEGPLVELAGFMDIRFSRTSAWHMRLALAVAYQPSSDEFIGGGISRFSSPLAIKLRVMPFAIDLGQYIALRVGGELGGQWVPRPGSDGEVEVFAGGAVELVGRLFDGLLEVGVFGGFQLTAFGELSRPNQYSSRVTPEGVVGVTTAGLLP